MKLSLLLCCMLFANNDFILTINDQNYSLQDFYALYPKKQWMRSDSTKKVAFYNDFIKRSLCVVEAKNLGLENDPEIRIKINTLSNQLLVNETYEQLVAAPLIDPSTINSARINAKHELLLHHILVGHSDSYLAQPPNRTINEALILSQKIKNDYLQGAPFKDLAIKYSDDPSATINNGGLGWVEWGLTTPKFQEAAFDLSVGNISNPILTVFGYHLIYVEQKRASDYYYMPDDQYENLIINLSKQSVRGLLRRAATTHDSLAIIKNNVLFNDNAIAKISNAYSHAARSSSASPININVYELLQSLSNPEVVLVYDGKGYGPLWFANKIKEVPPSRHPSLNTNDNVLAMFTNFVLQDIALKDGQEKGVDSSFAYLHRKNEIVSGILYDAYLKDLINDVSVPDSVKIKKYYDEFKKEKYSSKEAFIVNELRTFSKVAADSLSRLISSEKDFSYFYTLNLKNFESKKTYITNKTDPGLFDAASMLGINEISSVLSSLDGTFSIIQLMEQKPAQIQNFSTVYSRIEALLLKKEQDINKKNGIDGLIKKYDVVRNKDLLP